MTTMFHAARSLVLAAVFCSLGGSQTPAGKLTFEVVSIKPGPDGNIMALMRTGRIGQSIDDAQVALRGMSLMNVIEIAYDIPSERISGPSWLNDTRFDIIAKLPAAASKKQVPAMLQAMLADRFQLAARIDPRIVPVYALEVGKEPPKIQESGKDDSEPSCNGSLRSHLRCHKISMEEFANLLTARSGGGSLGGLDRPVIDGTGIKGVYDFVLGFGLVADGGRRGGGQIAREAGAPDPPAEVTWAEAVKLLGFKLQPAKHTFDYLVIDRVNRTPTEN